jgi:alkaline phosphatase
MRRLRRIGRVAVPAVAAIVVGAAVVPSAEGSDSASAARGAVQGGRARNVIMLLGDGMGDSEITVARNYAKGAAGRLAMDSLPMTGAYTTYAVQKDNPTKPEYVTDSAASASGWATGRKTYNGAISTTPDGKPQPTILELAQRAGYRTGDVTTAELTDATPAAVASHVPERGCQGPADMAACPTTDKRNGGPGSIAEQEVEHNVDVLLGGGKKRFDQAVLAGRYAGKPVTEQAAASGYTVVTDSAGLAKVNRRDKVLGLFSPGNMDLEWTGPLAAPFPANTTPVRCTESNPARPATMPHLSQLTTSALSLLDAESAGRGKGFFLQVEGASIDKQDHAANPCGQIGETVEFDRSIAVALAYARCHRDTLVVVTADHGHTSQIVEYPQTATHHSPGLIATLQTTEGAPMALSYATVAGVGSSQDHTGTEVRLAAKGPQAFRVLGVTNQTDLFGTFRAALALP